MHGVGIYFGLPYPFLAIESSWERMVWWCAFLYAFGKPDLMEPKFEFSCLCPQSGIKLYEHALRCEVWNDAINSQLQYPRPSQKLAKLKESWWRLKDATLLL